jgi:CubicO group peptidase (beta-lactamase class C family)
MKPPTTTVAAFTAGAERTAGRLTAAIDAILNTPIDEGKVAGGSVAVTQGGCTILSKAYGLSDLELDVATPADANYEIGSVTKQFTAASIMLLAERGALTLDDAITKYLPAYPVNGKHIAIRNLLTHTSGIKGYTELPEFADFSMCSGPRESLVSLFSAKPMDFEPGTALVYSNSGYFLAGLIIETVSGMSYADFVQKNLFDAVGMKNSYYCDQRAIRHKHAHGYDTRDGHLVLKGYTDHTWPFAAGSLASTAWDLAMWLNAFHGGRVLSEQSYRAMTTPAVLNDGTQTRYGLGVAIDEVGGRRVIYHDGGISGFVGDTEYFPEAGLAIAVLLNTAGPVSPRHLARAIADVVIGKGTDHSRPFAGDLMPFTGTFGVGCRTLVTVSVAVGTLMLTLAGPNALTMPLQYYGADTFACGDWRAMFERRQSRVTGLRLDIVTESHVMIRTGCSRA